MNSILDRFIVEPFTNFIDRLLEFLPSLLLAFLILAAGIIISLVFRAVLQKLLAALGLDRYAEKSGMMDLMKKGGVKEGFSRLMARLVYWLVLIMFVIIALGTLNLPEIDSLLAQFFLYMPSVFATVAIIFIGYVLSNFLAKATLVWAVNSGIRVAGLLGSVVKIAVMLLTVTMALEQLGIGRGTILVVFALTFGGVVLSLSIAFGLGGRDIASDFLKQQLRKKHEEKDEISHL